MANEIGAQFQLRCVNDELNDYYTSISMQIDQDVARLVRNVQNIGTVAEALEPGDLITPGFAVFVNLTDPDADPAPTNYVEVGLYISGTFYPFLKLKPGEQCGPMRLGIGTTEIYAMASADTVELFYIIYND